MKLQKKHFIIIGIILAILLILGYFIYKSLETPKLPPDRTIRVLHPLTGEDKARAKEIVSKKPIPLSKTDKKTAENFVFDEPAQLASPEKEMTKRIMGI